MYSFTHTLLVQYLSIFLISVLTVFYLYYQYCYTYWKRKGIFSLPPTFPTGNLGKSGIGQKSVFVQTREIHDEIKAKGQRYGGIYCFNGPVFMAVDPEIVKSVLQADFDHFVDRGIFVNEKKYTLSNHSFAITGQKWKNRRVKLTPAFTTGKIKSMFNIMMAKCQLVTKILNSKDQESVVDMKDLLLKLGMDIIGSAALGIDCDILQKTESDFATFAHKVYHPPIWKLFLLLFQEGLQNPGNLSKLSYSDRSVEKFLYQVVTKTIGYRDQNKIHRADFLNILMEMRQKGFSLEDIVGEVWLLFAVGFETASSTMTYCIHELAYNQDIQNNLRKEIQENLGNDSTKYTYEGLSGLKLLDKVIKGTVNFTIRLR